MVVNCFSEALKRNVTFHAVLPVDKRSFDGAGPRDDRPMKTLYLLHGVYEDGSKWLNHTRVALWAQDWNLAVIMPSGENKFYCDNPASNDNFAQFVGDDLVKLTRRLFNLSHKREDTYVAGLSMGGMGALLTGFRYPETFSCVGAFSSAVMIGDNAPEEEGPCLYSYDSTGEPIRRAQFYESSMGPLDQVPLRNDCRALAEECVKKGLAPKVFQTCGTSDFLLQPNRRYRDFLKNLGVELYYEEGEGGHDWFYWDKSLYHFLSWLPLEPMTPAPNSGHDFLHL